MATPQEWYAALPPVSKFWLTAAVVTSLGGKLNLFNLGLVGLDLYDLYNNLKQVFFGTRLPRGLGGRSSCVYSLCQGTSAASFATKESVPRLLSHLMTRSLCSRGGSSQTFFTLEGLPSTG